MAKPHDVRIKRVYDEPARSDGYRVLVDRVWPRGVSKERAAVDEWLKEVAPTAELRRWFGHDPDKFTEFADRYRAELNDSPSLTHLRELHRKHAVLTLLYGAKDTQHNQAAVLLGLLRT